MKLPQNWNNTIPKVIETPEESFYNFLSSYTKNSTTPHMDGQVHRFSTIDDKGKAKSGWYLAFDDEHPVGVVGDWRTGEQATWIYEGNNTSFSEEEREAFQVKIEKARELARLENEKLHEQTASMVRSIIENLNLASDEHPYLQRKQVKAHGLFITKGDNRLVMPIYVGDKLTSIQYISEDGTKQFQPGGEIKGGYFVIAGDSSSIIYMVEGYATGASVAEATGKTTVVALNAGNLRNVAEYIKNDIIQKQRLVIVADNDANGVGQEAARKCSDLAEIIIPPVVGDANDYAVAGYNLRELLTQEKDWLTPVNEFCAKPQPIKWLVKNWIQRDGLSMIFGDSGAGKTFLILDWVLRIAIPSMNSWGKEVIRHGGVIYLAGEGHQGLKARIAGWLQFNQVKERVNMWVSSSGCNLNSPEGISKAITEIRKTGCDDIAIIVVDTLHRFLEGDENKATDAKTMLDACSELSRTFNCAVVLIHHTGTAVEAKGRARGSTAWRGALDNQILVETLKNGDIKISQVKNKDAELADPVILEKTPVTVKGWYDEDGNPVSTVVLEITDKQPEHHTVADVTKSQQFALTSYRQAIADKGYLTAMDEPVVDEDDWRDVFYKMCSDEGKNLKPGSLRQKFSRAKSELLAQGILDKDNDCYTLIGEDYALEKAQIKKRIIAKQRW